MTIYKSQFDKALEPKLAKMEKLIQRLARRSRNVSKALITPYPISNAVFGEDVRGPVIYYMFPCSGTITKGIIDIGVKLKEGAKVVIDLQNKVHGEVKSYIITESTFLAEPNLSVDSGDKLTISIFPNGAEEVIHEAWVSFLWVPSVKEVDVKQCLIDELDGGLNGLLEEGN